MVGALLGDHVKGVLREGDWPDSWLAGIRLHRRIDALTDRHPALDPCRESLPPEWRRYGGLLIDVCLDHWLACHWSEVSDEPLAPFAQRVYQVLDQALPELPPSARRHASLLIRHQPLQDYRHRDMVIATLERIGRRLSRPNPLHRSREVLAPRWELWRLPMARFYRELPGQLELSGHLPAR